MVVAKRRLALTPAAIEIESAAWPVTIHTLGRFEVRRDGRPVTFAGKVQHKPLALLKAVVALGATDGAREERLIDLLWPDAEGDAGRFALTTTIHRLRRLPGHANAVHRQGQIVSLDARYCSIDAWDLQDLLARAESADSAEAATIASATERAIRLYQGPFLEGEIQSWTTR